MMRTPAFLVAALVVAPALLAAQQKVDIRHAAAADVSVRLSGSIGRVRVTGWAKDTVAVACALPKGVRLESAIGGDLRTPTRGMKMYVEAASDFVSSTGVLELFVPAGARIWVKTGTTDVEARDVTGGLDINVIGGRVAVWGSPRELQVEAMDATVTIDGSPPWLRAKTAAGDITVRGGSSDGGVTTVSGTIRLEGGSWERARVESVTGGVTFDGGLISGADVTIETHSGPVELHLATAGTWDLAASTLGGSITNEIDGRRPVPGREGRGEELSLSRGQQRSSVVVRTFKGNVVLRPR
jgi:hypothetical protein